MSMDCNILGIGQVPVSNYEHLSLGELAIRASRLAMSDAGVGKVDCIIIGTMLSSDSYLGPLVCSGIGCWPGTFIVNAACASGSTAIIQAVMSISSRIHDTCLVVGVEKMHGIHRDTLHQELALASDVDIEGAHGATFVSLNALLMQRYLYQYRVDRNSFYVFSKVAHKNATTNPNARLRDFCDQTTYDNSRVVSDPLRLHDCSPVSDGAAAVILGRKPGIQVLGCASASDTMSLQERDDPLWFGAIERSTEEAMEQAGVSHEDIDLLELHDAFTITTALSLESAGFAPRGEAIDFALDSGIHRYGHLPISTFGGLKARGHPVGASGVYQVVEAVLQLRGHAGANQVAFPEIAMTQNLGGNVSTANTLILSK